MKISQLLIFMLLIGFYSCKEDFLEPELSTSKDIETSINGLEDLEAVLIGAYDRMNEYDYYGRDYVIFGTVRSDNAFANGSSGRFVGPGQFFLRPTDAYPTETWQQIYEVIANANIVIGAEVEPSDEVNHVKGQAYAIRALAYMDLLRLFGQQYSGGNLGVPLILNFKDENIYPERATVNEVWEQVGSDLDLASQNMSSSLDSSTPTMFTSLAVKALQSRYYLYIEDYEKAAAAAEVVISSGKYALDPAGWSPDESPSTIFELTLTETDNLNSNSLTYIFHEGNYGDIEVTDDLYDLYEDGDVRKELFSVDGSVIRMVGKYPAYETNVRVIRYAEVILNYAEALTHLDSDDALATLNLIPENRNATLYAEANVENVLLERRKELAMEGFRFFDLMRYEMAIPFVDAGQTFKEDIPFGSNLLPFPIPEHEVSANSNIIQNDDY